MLRCVGLAMRVALVCKWWPLSPRVIELMCENLLNEFKNHRRGHPPDVSLLHGQSEGGRGESRGKSLTSCSGEIWGEWKCV